MGGNHHIVTYGHLRVIQYRKPRAAIEVLSNMQIVPLLEMNGDTYMERRSIHTANQFPKQPVSEGNIPDCSFVETALEDLRLQHCPKECFGCGLEYAGVIRHGNIDSSLIHNCASLLSNDTYINQITDPTIRRIYASVICIFCFGDLTIRQHNRSRVFTMIAPITICWICFFQIKFFPFDLEPATPETPEPVCEIPYCAVCDNSNEGISQALQTVLSMDDSELSKMGIRLNQNILYKCDWDNICSGIINQTYKESYEQYE